MSVIKNNDFLMGLFLILISILFYLNTMELASDVKMFPNIIILIIFVNAFVMIIKSIKASKKQVEPSDQKYTVNKNVLFMAGALFVYYFLIPFIGFYVTSFLFTLGSYLLVTKTVALKAIMKGGLFSIVFMMVVYFVFQVILKLITPSGILI